MDTKAGGYTCLSKAPLTIQSVLISQPAETREEQPGKQFKYDGCADEDVCGVSSVFDYIVGVIEMRV